MLLSKIDREKVKLLEKNITQLESLAQKNINESHETVLMNVSMLDGVPKNFIQMFQKKFPVSGKKDLVKLPASKRTSGLLGVMKNPEARKIFKHATDNIN